MSTSINRHQSNGRLRGGRLLQIGAILLVVAFAGWASGPGGLAAQSGAVLRVMLTKPAANAVYIAPASIVLSAVSNAPFAQMDFYANGINVGTSRAALPSVTWSVAAAGTYALTAVGVQVNGAQLTSPAVRVVIGNRADFMLPLVQKASFRRVGAFRVPLGAFGGSTFGYSGPIAYNPVRNSLFMVGHLW